MQSFNHKKTLRHTFRTLFFLTVVYLLLGYLAHLNMFYLPSYDAINLVPLLEQPTFTDDDYTLLFEQTGLGPSAINTLKKATNFIQEIQSFQSHYLQSLNIKKTNMNFITRLDRVFDVEGNAARAFKLAPLQDGDIFLTKSTYTANWRHGHAGIVIDAARGIILESLEPGTVSIEQSVSRWEFYPTFKMLRLKDSSSDELQAIVDYARTHLIHVPYNILAMKNQGDALTSTHCSFIVWQAFKHAGIDLDSNGGLIVTPEDIARSPHLETVQIFGFHPKRAW